MLDKTFFYILYKFFFFIVSMEFLHRCPLHNRIADKLCAKKPCCQVMCDRCFLQHTNITGHDTALIVSQHALTFFCTFTGHTHYKMFEWEDSVRRFSFFSVFQAEGGETRFRENGTESETLCVIGLQVLQEYQTLTQNNRQFVLNNRNSQQLLHPQFLKDLFKIVTEKWQTNSEIIINSLYEQVEKILHVKPGAGVPKFSIRPHFITSIQTYRTQLLGKNIQKILITAADIQRVINYPDEYKQIAQDLAETNHELYQLPYSIKQIQSFQQIGQRRNRARNTICSITHEPAMIQEVNQTPEDLKINQLNIIIEMLKQQNLALHQENRLLKDNNNALEKDKQELCSKIQSLQKAISLNKQNQQAAPPLSNIQSKSHYVLKMPARMLSLAEPLKEETEPVSQTSVVRSQLLMGKVRVLKL